MRKRTLENAAADAERYWDDLQFSHPPGSVIDAEPILDHATSVVHDDPVFAAALILHTAERLGVLIN